MNRLLALVLVLSACDDAAESPPEDSSGSGSSSTSAHVASSGAEAGSTSGDDPATSTGSESSSSSSAGGSESTGSVEPAAEAETTSLCGEPAAIIRSSVRLPAGVAPASGDLVFSLLHRRYGDPSQGGHPHAVHRVPNVTLVADEAFAFEIDMCDANATMWSEENCEFNLVVSLDLDGDNGLGPGSLVPEAGEPTAMAVFELSCHAEGPTCLDFELSCLQGAACVAYEAPGACECAANGCNSQAAICEL